MEKTCNTCKLVKPVDDFYKRKASTDGRMGWCKVCLLEYNKRYHLKLKRSPEKIQQYRHARKIKLAKRYLEEIKTKNV